MTVLVRLVLVLGLAVGCSVEVERVRYTSPELASEEPWAACDTGNPCAADVFCDEAHAEWPACWGHEDECVHGLADDGLSCFPRVDAVAPGWCRAGLCSGSSPR